MQHPEAFIIISGDFNHVTLDSTLAAFHQVVNCPIRKNRTIDLLYANVKEAYRVTTPAGAGSICGSGTSRCHS